MPMLSQLAATLARHSADEMVVALGLGRAPVVLRRAVASAFYATSVPLGRILAAFDERIAAAGVHVAAEQALLELGARWDCAQSFPPSGPVLVVANHPGAYDALVLLSAMRRADVAIIVEDRSFLRALPTFSRHLLFGSHRAAGATSLRKALRHLSRGGVLLHFGAGRIEPDPEFTQRRDPLLLRWSDGTGALVRGVARAGGSVVAALVSGVHSPRAKRLMLNRVAEHFGVTTLAPLLQVALPRYHDVHAHAVFSEPQPAVQLARMGQSDAMVAEQLRSLVAQLSERRLNNGSR
jgi:hypothetical protein